jgi:Bacterial Ig domain/Calcineurin-like phosphoesterase/Concanavalin A-like lectin/glucanases superfamily/Purple acid Phosphatase, N-terminal domain
MNRILSKLLVAALTAATACLAHAQVSYTGGVYSQNFNTLAGTTNNTLNATWTDNSTLPGWYANKTTFSVTDATVGGTAATFDATSAANNVGLFSFGTAASTDRALGARATSQVAGNDPVLYGVRLVNNTTQTLTKFTVTYTGEQWFASTQSAAHTLLLDYQFGASGIAAGTWTAVTAATFTAPISTGTTARSLAGNTTANRTVKVAVVTGVSWAPGQELWVRFRDANESGNEQGLAADDFSFIADNESGLFFNGSTSYITMGFGSGTAATLGASSFTLECRVMRTGPGATASTGTGGVTANPLIAKGVGEADGDNRDANYFLGIDANGKLVADFEQLNATNNGTAYAAGQNFPVTGSTTLQDGVIYHVAATYDTTTATWKLYVNGVAETITQTIPTFVGVAPRNDSIQGLGIGTTINSTGARSGFFQGLIDEVRIWNVARSATEILANKDQKIAIGTTGLLARYGFDEASGTTVAGINAAGTAAPVGTLSGTQLPTWVNSATFVPNIAPTVTLTSPIASYTGTFPATVNFAATAADSDGAVAKVEFFNGATKLGEDLTAPYAFDWTGVAAGTYTLTAVATDNTGATTTSTAVTITVSPNNNQPAVVTLAGPANNATGIGSSTSLDLGLADGEGDALTVTYYGRRTAPATPGADFSFIALPDTQFYSENTNSHVVSGSVGANESFFYAQTQWMVANQDTRKIAFVSHMGDIAQNGDANQSEWLVADKAMKYLEDPATTLRPHGIPWGVAQGNHDQGLTGNGNAGDQANFYVQYFNYGRWADRPYYGGYFGTKSGQPANVNSYYLFSAGGLDFIVVHMEYDVRAQSFFQPVLDWADALLKAYPNRRAIITSHWIINTGSTATSGTPATFSAQGQAIYNALKNNSNLFLMLCGHVDGEGMRTDTFNGHTVYSVLQDYQERANGGNGFLRIYTFSPANNTITLESYSPVLNRAVNAGDGCPQANLANIVLPYNMQTSVTDWIPLGTVNVASGGTAAPLSWTGLEAGKDYEWYATVNDGVNTTTTATRRFSTTANVAPTVTLDAPLDGATVALPATLTLTATAADADSAIAKVEFFDGAARIGQATTAPYSITWSGATTGSHKLTAVVTDSTGLDAVSGIATITVTNPANLAPSVTLTANATVVANSSLALTASASDTDGSIAKVAFYLGATKLGEDLVAPYAYTWSGGSVGSYAFTAVATDNDGGTTTSSVVNVTVIPAGAFITSYTQDFNALGTAGTTPPEAWTIWNGTVSSTNSTWTDAIPIFGGASTVANSVGTMVKSTAALTASAAPTTTANNGYNAANPGNTADRLLATSPTGTNGVANQLELTNISTSTITAISVAYDIRRFTAVATANELPGYRLFYSLDNGSTWTNVSALNPTLAGPTGVIVPNTVGVTTVPATEIVLSTSWAVGSTLQLRWVDDNAVATSPDQIVGLDNVSILVTQSVPVIGVPPTVSLTSPANNASLLTPANVTLTASAADSDGTIAKVEFYQGATKLGEATAAPFTYTWANAPVGTYSLTAKATDNDGNAVLSTGVSITVSYAPGSSGVIQRGPYLNQANQNSIVVRWRSSLSTVGRVRYGTSVANLDQFTDDDAATLNHEVKLTGLTPYTRYYYSVGSAVDTLTPETADTTSFRPASVPAAPSATDYTFRTSPVSGTATDTRVWVVGDCGRGSAAQATGRDAYYTWMGARVPDLNLELGDNAYNSGTDTEYQTGYFLMYPSIFRKMPQWSCLGNHDSNNGDTNPTTNWPYYDMFTFPKAGECGGVASGTEHYYSFNYGNIHFIALDSQASSTAVDNPATTGVNEDGPMATWLRSDLAANTATWTIVFFHHPPYSKGSHDSDSEAQMVNMRTNFNPILEAGGVDLVLNGHSHNYERSVLLDGNYGTTTTITSAMKLNAGNGSTTGFTTGSNGVIRNAANSFTATATVNGTVIPPDGAYVKPLTGPRDHFGAVYNTAGMSGQADGGSLNHTAMYISYNTVGTVNLDINGNTLVATYVQAGGTQPDNYTIVKQGAADTDHDGLSDEYEIANGLNRFSATDATLSADLDGDGLSNFLEFALGTAANSANAAGQAGVPVATPGTGADLGKLQLGFTRMQESVTYTVQGSDDLKTWTDLVTNPGTVGQPYVFTDANTTSPNRYLRLKASSGALLDTTVPSGRVTLTLPTKLDTSVSFPLADTATGLTGRATGFITAVGASTLDNSAAGWVAGELSVAAAPYFVRITKGVAAGRLFLVSTSTANTATSLTVNAPGIDLTTLGIVAGADTYEIVPADTLASLFPVGTLQSGTATTADLVRVLSGTTWLTYYHDGSTWVRQGAVGSADDTVIRPDQGLLVLRRGPAKTLVIQGRAPSTRSQLTITRGRSNFVGGLPLDTTFGELAVQTLPGWTSNLTKPASGDHVEIWNGAAWIVYFHNGTNWVRQGAATSVDDQSAFRPGRPLLVVRPTGTGADVLTHNKTY